MCTWAKYGYQRIDPCMREVVNNLKKAGANPLASCCGHGQFPKTIVVRTTTGKNIEYYSGVEIPRKKRFYFRDCYGAFFIPEVDHHFAILDRNERCLNKIAKEPFYIYEAMLRYCSGNIGKHTCAGCPFRRNLCDEGAPLLYADFKRGKFSLNRNKQTGEK
jgi:hypothetical protein